MRRDPQFSDLADGFHAGLTELDRLADDSPDHAEILDGLKWIWEKPRSVGERLCKKGELWKLEGHPVVVDLPRFTGW
jgi:hypothetical protein